MIDPYRTLGLAPGAPVAEIKRAYRRLAKEHHPDSAGPAALPRFLAIQAAYEMLVEGRPGEARPGAARAGTGRAGSAPGPAWQADPSRARAAREAWRRSRADRGRGFDHAGDDATAREQPGEDVGGRSRGSSGGAGPSSAAGGTSPDGADRPSGSARGPRSRRRGDHTPRRATPGSTSYDEAVHEPFEPDWSGGSWYGESSGTYWTINPREYADPRKHGPEYLARARRAAEAGDPETAGGAESVSSPDGEPDSTADATGGESERSWTATRGSGWTWSEPARDRGRAPGSGEPGPRPWTASADGRPAFSPGEVRPNAGAQDGTSRPAGRDSPADGAPHAAHAAHAAASAAAASAAARSRGRWAPSRPTGSADARTGVGSIPTSGDGFGTLIGLGEIADRIRHEPPSFRVRVFLALGAWPPIGLALALGIGELTGCARFAATCSSASSFSAWVVVAQIMIVSVLLLAVPLARIGTFGSLAILLAALPIVALLVAAGATYDPEAGTAALLTMLAIAWVVGVVVGLRGSSRRMPP